MDKNALLSAVTLAPGLPEHADYAIKRELGRGGMGIVYLAHNTLMGRDEVLKVIGPQIMDRPGILERFLREIRSVAKLRHPNIVTAYHAARLSDRVVFSMEYVEGVDLARLVEVNGPLPLGHACNFVYQAALGLQHAHEQGLVHRDIKPGNLMLARSGGKATVKVLDFGLAKATRGEEIDCAITAEGQAVGTPDFIAPEQILDATNVDIRADIYSLGGTLYYLLTGHAPFKTRSPFDLYHAHISRDAEPLDLVRPEVPAELAALVAKMMAKQPAGRFQTPGEVAHALKDFFGPTDARFGGEATDLWASAWAEAARDTLEATPDLTGENRIEFEETDPPADARGSSTSPESSPRGRRTWSAVGERLHARGPRTVCAAVGLIFLGLAVALAALIIKVRTQAGVIVLENVPEDAIVEVDGNRVELTPRIGLPITIESPAGKHVVIVKRGSEVLTGETVILESGKQYNLSVRLEDPVASPPQAGGPSSAAPHTAVKTSRGEPTTPSIDSEGWGSLFNGRDKTNWIEGPRNQGTWKVVDGVLEGHGGAILGQMAVLLTTRKDYSNFRLRARIFNEGQGKQLRVRMRPNADVDFARDGYGINVGGTKTVIGDTIPLGSIKDHKNQPKKSRIDWDVVAEAVPIEFNGCYTLEIIAIGNRITTSVNGKKVAEFADETNPILTGKIAVFCRARDKIRFQEISIKELPDDSVLPALPRRTSKTKH